MSRSSSGFAFHPRSRFDAFLEGQLSASADQRMRAHLAECPQCAQEVEQRSSALFVTQKLDKISRGEPVNYPAPATNTVMESDGGPVGRFLLVPVWSGWLSSDWLSACGS